MKYLLLFIIPLALCSCATQRAYNKATRNLERFQKVLREHPELADSLQIVTRDTTKTTPLQAHIVYEKAVDSAMVDALARELCDRLRTAEQPTVQPPPGPHQAPTRPPKPTGQIRKELSTLGCPEVTKDTTLHVRIFNKKWSKDLPIDLSIRSFAGRLQVDVSLQAVQIPEEQIKTVVQLTPRPPFYKDLWFWLFCLVLVLYGLVSAIRR